MAHVIAKKNQAKLAEDLYKKSNCNFSKLEVEALLHMFRKLVSTPGSQKMERSKFRDVLHNTFCMTDDMLMDRIFRAFDTDNDGYVSMEEWVMGLSKFLRGSLDEEMRFCFAVYDLNQDSYISRDEMFQLLKTSLIKQQTEEDPDEGIKDLVEIALKKMDYDHDGRLCFADFSKAVKSDQLLLESLGPCLPSNKSKKAFLATFCEMEGEDAAY